MSLYEAAIFPHYAGFGMYSYGELCEVDYAENLSDWEKYMSNEYDWEWEDELDGKVYNQNGGRIFKYRVDKECEWNFGIIWEE